MIDTPPPVESQDSARRENQLRFVVDASLRYWKLIAGVTLATTLGYGLFGVFSLYNAPPPQYEASLQLAIKQSHWESQLPLHESASELLKLSPRELIKRVEKEAVAKTVLAALEQDTESPASATPAEAAQGGAIARIASAMSLTEVPETNRLTLIVRSPDRSWAARVADVAAQALAEHNNENLSDAIENARTFIQQELATIRVALDNAEAKEWAFLREKGFNTYEDVSRQLRGKTEELAEAQAEKTGVLRDLGDIEAELHRNDETLPVALSQITDSLIVKLIEELEELRIEELAMAIVYENAYPPLVDIRADIAEKEETVLEAVRRYEEANAPGENAWDSRRDLRRRHMQLQLRCSELETQIKALEQSTADLFEQLPEFARDSHGFSQILREVEGYRKQYDRMLERDFELRSTIRAGAGQLERFSDVVTKALPVSTPRHGINFAIGAIVGLVVGFALAITLDMMDTSIHDEDDIARYLDKPVIGTIPLMRFPSRGRRRQKPPPETDMQAAPCLVTIRDPQSPIAEAYRILRTNFQFATFDAEPRTLMITSAVPGEGKTTTAINLAVAMAANGLRVLLLDCDLRRPNVHRMLGLARSPGLGEVLGENADPHGVIQPTQIQNLLVMTSGGLPSNPSELIGSERMQTLINRLGQEFDLVVCDVPSVIVVTDPLVMAKQVDSILMLVSANNARRTTIARALKLLNASRGNVVGIVLNGLEASRRRNYYYYYYYETEGKRQKRRWHHA